MLNKIISKIEDLKNCLLVYTEDAMPKFYIFGANHHCYSQAVQCNSLLVNLNDEKFGEDVVDFVIAISSNKHDDCLVGNSDIPFGLTGDYLVVSCGFAF